MGGTGLYHISRKLNSSGLSLGRRSLVSAPRRAAAGAEAMNKRRFIIQDHSIALTQAKACVTKLFYSSRRGEAFVNCSLRRGLVGLAEAIVDAREVVVHVRLIGADRNAALQLRRVFLELPRLFEQHAAPAVACPLVR